MDKLLFALGKRKYLLWDASLGIWYCIHTLLVPTAMLLLQKKPIHSLFDMWGSSSFLQSHSIHISPAVRYHYYYNAKVPISTNTEL